MGLFEHWPYVNFHDMNLDWIIKKIKNVETAEANSLASAEASAESAAASQLSADAALASQEAAHQSEENAADSEASAKNYADHIADPVAGLVTDWLADHVTPTTPIVDDTLTISGAAADAKETGDEITDLKSATQRTIGYLAENLFPASLINNGTEILLSGCTATMSRTTFILTATRNTELNFGSVATSAGTSYSDSMGAKIPVTEGDVVNIKLGTAFTKNFVTFFNSSNQSFSWKEYDANNFTITAPPNSAYFVLRVGVPSVTSGTDYSTTITVVKSFKSVVESTANKETQYAMFKDDLLDGLDFVVGGLDSNGEVYAGQNYRASTRPVLCFDKPFRIVVPSGKAIGYYEFNSGVAWHGWWETAGESFTIPANTSFRLQTRRHPEDTSVVISDATAFVEDFSFELVSNLTALEERVGKLEIGLPSYYYENDWLDERIEEIHDACSFLNGVSFPFITDLHFDSNALNSKYLLKEVLDKTACSMVISGGDYATMYGTQAKLDEEYQTLLDYAGYIGHENWFSMLGNHDFYNAVSSSDPTRHSFTWGKTYNGVFRNSERWQINPSVNNGYYCIDNVAQKTRFIILNSCEPASATSDYEVNGASIVKNGQLQYLYDRIAELEGYNIVVFSHIASDPTMTAYTNDMLPIQTILEAFANKTSFSTRGTGDSDVTGDFANTTNTLICHISGHAHKDESHISNGVLSIATTCDAHYQDDGHGATVGTVSEQAFDVFCIDYDTETIKAVRIGRGNSRNWTY